MNTVALLAFYSAKEARSNAHNVLRTRLPGRVIYFKAEMRRAIRKWQQYAEAVRAKP